MSFTFCGVAFGFGQFVQGGEAARFYSALDGSWVAGGDPRRGSEPHGGEPAHCYDNVEREEAGQIEALSRRLLLLRDRRPVAVGGPAHGFATGSAQANCVSRQRWMRTLREDLVLALPKRLWLLSAAIASGAARAARLTASVTRTLGG